MTDTSNVVRIYGDEEPQIKPQTLKLPREPYPLEIKHLRQDAALTKEEAAKVCDVSVGHFRRWESGNRAMPAVTWAWFRIYTSKGMVSGGPNFEGWYFEGGKLYSPDGWGGFTAPELRSWTYVQAQRREMRLENQKLKEEIQSLKDNQGPLSHHGIALGQIDVIGLMVSLLANEYSHHEDPLLRDLSKKLNTIMEDSCTAKLPILNLHIKKN